MISTVGYMHLPYFYAYIAQVETALEKSHNVEKEMMEKLQVSMGKCKELEEIIEGSPWKV